MSQKMVIFTGGIGSGKSYITAMLPAMGIPVYDCDPAAKRLYDTDTELLTQMTTLFGPDILNAAGKLRKEVLASKVFGSSELLQALESIVHPAIIRDFNSWRAALDAEIIAIESAIILEKPLFNGIADYIVAVCAPEDVRLQRAMMRDEASREAILKRMSNQWGDEQRCARANYVITNDGEQPLLPQLIQAIENVKHI